MKKRKPAAPTAKPAARPVAVDMTSGPVASQPSVRTSILWNPASLRTLALQADGGDLQRLGDLVEQIIADDRMGQLLESLASDVLGCDLTFEKSPRHKVGDAEKAADLESDWPIGYDDTELTQLIMWTLVNGVGFAKHEQWIDHEGRIVPHLKWWHPKQFAYRQIQSRNAGPNTWERQWYVRDDNGNWTPITAGDGTWVILTRRGEFRPWSNGLWRGLAPWWMLKQYAISDWGVHSEKASKLVIMADSETTSEQRKAISKYVYEASKDAVIALPVGFKMELIELTADTREIYDAQIQAANECAAIAILGQNLSTNVQGGSRSAAEVHERKENRKVRYVGQMLSKGLREQSLSWWAEFNYGDRNLAPFPHWHTEPAEDYAAKSLGLKTLADGLLSLKNAGYKLSTDSLEEEYGVELEEVAPPAPAPIQGAPGPKLVPSPGKIAPPKPVAPKKKSATAEAGGVLLASGDDPESAPGFVAGQVYADALTDKETELAADSLREFVDRIAEAVDGAEDYESVRSAVIKAFADEEDPDRLVELIEHGILLANLAGRHAVDEDLVVETAPKTKLKGAAADVARMADELIEGSLETDERELGSRIQQHNSAAIELAAAILGQLNQ